MITDKIFSIMRASKLTLGERTALTELILDLSLKQYKDGLEKGAEIYADKIKEITDSRPKVQKKGSKDLFASE